MVEGEVQRTARHYCFLHEGGEERALAAARYIRQGLLADERVLLAHDGDEPSDELEALENIDVDPHVFISRGQLVVAPGREVYLEDGELDPDWMLERLRAEVRRARADGYSGLRIVGGTEWRHRVDVDDALMEFERRGNEALEGLAWAGLCQYRVDRTDPDTVEALLESHDRTFTTTGRMSRIRELAGREGRRSVHPVDAIVDLEEPRGPDSVSGPESGRAGAARPQLEQELRRAIERREFVLRYQPIMALESEEVVGAEALVRWQHPEQGLLAPEAFLGAAERTGKMGDIGQLALDGAVSSLRRWEEERLQFHPFTLSLNLFDPQYRQPGLAERVNASLRRQHVDPRHLQLEISEAVATRMPERLLELREVGVRVAVDDIATSHALEQLRDLGADAYKIDREIVDAIGDDSREEMLVESILGLARRQELPVVAQGIGRNEQLERLRRLGCPFGQGPLFARPLPEEEFEELLGARVIGGIGEQETDWIADG